MLKYRKQGGVLSISFYSYVLISGPYGPWRDCPFQGWLIPMDSKGLDMNAHL